MMGRRSGASEHRKAIRDFTRPYCRKDDRIAAASYFGTYAVFFACLAGAALSWPNLWGFVPLAMLAGVAGVRLYVLQHDCGHHALFSTKRANELAGLGLSLVTLTPFRAMQHNHNVHHYDVGNLDRRETTEIHTMTLREWEAASAWRRLGYRIYRNPAFLMLAGGVFVFFLHYRWPKNTVKAGLWRAVVAHNLMLMAFLGALWTVFGWAGIWAYLAAALMAAPIGVFLVYLQHNFEDTHWGRKPELDFAEATLDGSSCLDLGWWFDLATGCIAYHDIHHFNPAIPSYRLRRCHRELRKVVPMRTIRWPEAIRSFGLKLWDEEAGRLVPFPKAAAPAAAAVPAE
jgi:omega-6 fatty acid desaturase (delta-12 desaturase)